MQVILLRSARSPLGAPQIHHSVGFGGPKPNAGANSGGLAKPAERVHYPPKISGGIHKRSQVEEPVMCLLQVVVVPKLPRLTRRNDAFASLLEQG